MNNSQDIPNPHNLKPTVTDDAAADQVIQADVHYLTGLDSLHSLLPSPGTLYGFYNESTGEFYAC